LDTNEDKSLEEAKPSTEEQKKEEIEEEETAEAIKETAEEKGAEEEKTEEAEEEEELKEEAAEEIEEVAPEEAALEEVEEEEKAKEAEEKKPEEEPEEEIVEERIYTIPLSRAWISPRKKRTPRATRIVRSFIQKHMKIKTGAKAEEEEEEAGRLVISDEVNKKLWSRGIEKPPRKIRVRAVKDKEGTVTLYLAEGD